MLCLAIFSSRLVTSLDKMSVLSLPLWLLWEGFPIFPGILSREFWHCAQKEQEIFVFFITLFYRHFMIICAETDHFAALVQTRWILAASDVRRLLRQTAR